MLATVPFLAIEGLFVIGGLPKVFEGGWIPLTVSAIVFVIASAWRSGRRRVALAQVEQSLSVDDFLRERSGKLGVPRQGTAVFLTGDPEGVPFVLRHHLARTHSMDERIVLLTIIPTTDPYVTTGSRVHIERLSEGLVRITARFGFMEKLELRPIVEACGAALDIGSNDTTFYSADPQIVAVRRGFFQSWQRSIFMILRRNSRSVTTSLGIPADAHAKLCFEVPM